MNFTTYIRRKPRRSSPREYFWRSILTNPLGVDSRMWAIIMSMPAYLYCTAYTRMTMNESSPLCEQRRITFNDDGQKVQLARLELPTTPLSPSRHYYPRLIAGTNLPTPKGWIAWLVKADCTHITFGQGYYTIKSKGTGRK